MSDNKYIQHLDVQYNPITVLDIGQTYCSYMPASCCREPSPQCNDKCPGTRQAGWLMGGFRMEIKDRTGLYSWLNKVYGIRPFNSNVVYKILGFTRIGNSSIYGENHDLESILGTFDQVESDLICSPCSDGDHVLFGTYQTYAYSATGGSYGKFRYAVTHHVICNSFGLKNSDWEVEGYVTPEPDRQPEFLLLLRFVYRPVSWGFNGCDFPLTGAATNYEQYTVTDGGTILRGLLSSGSYVVLPLTQSGCNPLRLSLSNYPLKIDHTHSAVLDPLGFEYATVTDITRDVGAIDINITECDVGCPGLSASKTLYWSFNGADPVAITPRNFPIQVSSTSTLNAHLAVWDIPYDPLAPAYPHQYKICATPINYPQITDGFPDLLTSAETLVGTDYTYYNRSNEADPPSQRVLWYVAVDGVSGHTSVFSCNPLDVSILDSEGNSHRITDSFRHVETVTGVVGYKVEFTRVLVQAANLDMTVECDFSCDTDAVSSGPATPTSYDSPAGESLKDVALEYTRIIAGMSPEQRIVRDPDTCCNGSDHTVIDQTLACKPTTGQSFILSINGHNYVSTWTVTYDQPDGFSALGFVDDADGYFSLAYDVNAAGTINVGITWTDHGNTPPGALGPTVNCGPPIVFSAYIDGVLITVTT